MTLFFKRIVLFSIFFAIYFCAIAQTKTDSPFDELIYAKHDSIKARLYYECGKLYANEFPDSAILFYHKSIELAETVNRLDIKAGALRNMSTVFIKKRYLDKGSVLLKEALSIETLLENNSGMSKCYHNLASLSFIAGYLDSARFYQKEAFRILKLMDDKVGLSRGYTNIGAIHEYEGNIDSAILYYEKGLEIAIESKSFDLVAIGYNNLASILSHKGEYYQCIENFEKAIYYYQLKTDFQGLGFCYRNLAMCYIYLTSFDKAFQCLHKAVQNYTKVDDQAGIAGCYVVMGDVYFKIGDYVKTSHYYEKCLNIQEGQNDYDVTYRVYKGLGELYQKQKNHSKAIEAFGKALRIAEQTGVQHYIVFSYINIGIISADMRDYKKSLEMLEKAIALARKTKAKKQIAMSLGSLAEVQIAMVKDTKNKQNEYLYQAISNLKEALKITKEIKAADEVANSQKNLSIAYELLHNYNKALQFHKQYTITKDSIMDIEKYKTISELEIKYQIEQKELQIQKQDIELKKKQQAIQFYIIVVLMLGTGIFFISLIYRKKQKAFKKLAEKNIEAATKCNNEETNQKLYEFSEKQQNIFKKLSQAIKNDQIYTDVELTIDSMAKFIQTNRTELSQVLKKFSDKTYPVFINEQRIKHAVRLLVDYGTKYSIEGIANESGFKSTSNFYKLFKENTGMTPAEFQKSSMS